MIKNDEIPKYPLYGYDNSEELDQDVEYMKGIYPQTVRKILVEVEDQCDRLEYDGSSMFSRIPDAVTLGKITDDIYIRIAEQTFAPLEAESLRPPYGPCGPGRYCPPPPMPMCPPNRPCYQPPRPDYDNNGQPDWMRNLISVLLYNEMVHRRRRYRSRKQWF
ncbi:MAG: hypothetical protein RR056_07435 [Acetivibrio sp.]